MWRFFIVGALLSAIYAVKLDKCQFGPLPLDLRSTSCNETHCAISASSPVGFELDAKIKKNTIHVFPSVLFHYNLPEGKGEYPINIDIRRGCKYIVSHTCPLKKGDVITWALDWDFLPADIFKIGAVFKGQIVLHDEFQDHVMCLKVNLVVVK